MYSYRLINNHYAVDINGKNYLIDTGIPFSFSFDPSVHEIEIDGRIYPLMQKPIGVEPNKIFTLVGMKLDGFIGLDIISDTSLTIYKNGTLYFSSRNEDGLKIKNLDSIYILFQVNIDGEQGFYLLDTGAKYGYGVKRVFKNKTPFERNVYDYNPSLKELYSDMYHIDVSINRVTKTLDVGDNDLVGMTLNNMRVTIIGNVTTLFDEVVVFDMKNHIITLR